MNINRKLQSMQKDFVACHRTYYKPKDLSYFITELLKEYKTLNLKEEIQPPYRLFATMLEICHQCSENNQKLPRAIFNFFIPMIINQNPSVIDEGN